MPVVRTNSRQGRSIVSESPFAPLGKGGWGGSCGHKADSVPLSVREWTFPQCGTVRDRHINTAQNLLAVGHTVTACGASVRLEGHCSGKE
jgi:putative transposase